MDSSISENTARRYICAVCFHVYRSKQSCQTHVISRSHYALGGTQQMLARGKLFIPNWSYEVGRSNASSVELIVYDIKDEHDMKKWLDAYMQINGSHFIMKQTKYVKSFRYTSYVCEHYQDPHRATARKKKVKGTNCQCRIKIILRRGLAEVTIENIEHNHSLTSAAATAFQFPSKEVQQRFLEMFEHGLGPADALMSYTNFIRDQSKSDSEFQMNVANSGVIPNYDWVRHFFNKTVKNKYARSKIDGVAENLREFIGLNFDTNTCKFVQFDDKNFGVAILTPLMRRISETKIAGELLFIDSCGSVDKLGLRIFFLMTKINAAGYPVGVIITTKETVPALQKMFTLFRSLRPSFGNRKKKGPANIIAAVTYRKTEMLKKIFPAANYFLCSFHVLRSVYHWLWKAENRVAEHDRKLSYCHFRNMLHAKSLEEIDFYYNGIVEHVKNIRVVKFIQKLYDKKEKWALYFRKGSLVKSSNTNNITERDMRMLKEHILTSIKTQTSSQLVDYIIKDFSKHFAQKLIDCALLKNPNLKRLKNNLPQNADDYQFQKDDEWMYSVINQKTNVKYNINVDLGICSCFVGFSGSLCKHQLILSAINGVFEQPLCFPETEDEKWQLYSLATGDKTAPQEFFKLLNERMPLAEISTNADYEQFKEIIQYISCDTSDNDDNEDTVVNEELPNVLEVANAQINEFEELSKELVRIMRENPCAYSEHLEYFNKELKLVAEISMSAR